MRNIGGVLNDRSGNKSAASPSPGCSSAFRSTATGETAARNHRYSQDQRRCPSSAGSNRDSGSDHEGSWFWRCAGQEAISAGGGGSRRHEVVEDYALGGAGQAVVGRAGTHGAPLCDLYHG